MRASLVDQVRLWAASVERCWARYWVWLSGFRSVGFLTGGFTMVQVGEYAAAQVFWSLACACGVSASFKTESKAAQCSGILASVAILMLLLTWTFKKKGDQTWSAFQKPIPSF